MARYVVFLRGINVGGRIIKMNELKNCFDNLGFDNVRTVLQSGNVLFETTGRSSAQLKKVIEIQLTTIFNYPAKAQVYELGELQAIINDFPFNLVSPDQHDYVVFLENGLEQLLVKEDYILAENEQVKAARGVVYWQVSRGLTLQSQFAKLLTKAKYRDFNTNRNLKTLKKLI